MTLKKKAWIWDKQVFAVCGKLHVFLTGERQVTRELWINAMTPSKQKMEGFLLREKRLHLLHVQPAK